MTRQEYQMIVKAEKSSADPKRILYKINFMKEGINIPLSINIADMDSLLDLKEMLMAVMAKVDAQITARREKKS